MLTYQCRVVLRELKKLTNNTDANFCYLFCTHSFSLDNSEVTYDYGKFESEIDSIMDTLIAEGYVKTDFIEYNIKLTQKANHECQFLLPYIAHPITYLITWILGIVSAFIAEYLIQNYL